MSGHLSMRPTWTSPGRVDGPAWPCTGRGLPGRRVTATPVRSYRTISPLPVRDSRAAAPSAVCFCGTFPRVSPGGRYPPPRPMVSGLSSRGFLSPRGRSARRAMVALPGSNNLARTLPAAVVTGAGSGLGRAIARELAGRGFSVRPPTSIPRRPPRPRRRSARAPTRRRSTSATRTPAGRWPRRSWRAAARSTSGSTTPACSSPATSWSRTRRPGRRCSTSTRSGTMNGTVAALERMIAAGRGHVINVDLAGGDRRGARRGRLLGEQARGDGLHARHPLRPAARRASRESSSAPSARTGSGRRCSRTSSTIRDAAGSFSGKLLTAERGRRRGRQADRASAADPDPAPLARPAAAPLRPLPPPRPATTAAGDGRRAAAPAPLQKADRVRHVGPGKPALVRSCERRRRPCRGSWRRWSGSAPSSRSRAAAGCGRPRGRSA